MIQPKRVVNTALGEPLAGRGARYMMTRGFVAAWTASLLVAGALLAASCAAPG